MCFLKLCMQKWLFMPVLLWWLISLLSTSYEKKLSYPGLTFLYCRIPAMSCCFSPAPLGNILPSCPLYWVINFRVYCFHAWTLCWACLPGSCSWGLPGCLGGRSCEFPSALQLLPGISEAKGNAPSHPKTPAHARSSTSPQTSLTQSSSRKGRRMPEQKSREMWTVLEELWRELCSCKEVLCAILEGHPGVPGSWHLGGSYHAWDTSLPACHQPRVQSDRKLSWKAACVFAAMINGHESEI